MSSPAKILLVEDDKFTGRMMEIRFQQSGFQARLVSGAEEALKVLRRERFDLVLSDLIMPGKTGLELLTEIRRSWNAEALPVIIVSASGQMDRSGEVLAAGANDFLVKTHNFAGLLQRIQEHIPIQKRGTPGRGAHPAQWRCSPDGLWTWTIASNQVYYSSRWKAILGFGADELSSSPREWLDRIHPEEREEVQRQLEALQRREVPWLDMNFRLRGKDGHHFWAHCFGVAFFDKSGKASRIIGSLNATVPTGAMAREAGRLHEALAAFQDRLTARLSNPELPGEAQHALLEELSSISLQSAYLARRLAGIDSPPPASPETDLSPESSS